MAEYILQCILGVLAVFGGYCCIKLISSQVATPGALCNCVLIDSAEQVEVLPEIIEDALNSLFVIGRKKPVVFFSESLFDNGIVGYDGILFEEYERILDSYGLDWNIYIANDGRNIHEQ